MYVRRCVAKNPQCTEAILRRLEEDKDEWVRWYVAKNPNSHSRVLALLTGDKQEVVRTAAQENLAERGSLGG